MNYFFKEVMILAGLLMIANVHLHAMLMSINTFEKILIPQGYIAVFNTAHTHGFSYLSSAEYFIDHTTNLSADASLFLKNVNYMFIFYQHDNRLEIFSPQYGLIGLVYKLLLCNRSATYTRFIDSCTCLEKSKNN